MAETPKRPARKTPAKKAAPRKRQPVPPAPPRDPDHTHPGESNVVRFEKPGGGRGTGKAASGKGLGAASPLSPKNVAVAQRRAEALQLRVAGATFAQIAQTLIVKGGAGIPEGYDAGSARRDVTESMERNMGAAVDELRDEEITRARWYMRSLSPGIQKGDPEVIAVALRVDIHVAKLLGLYNPISIQHTGADGGPILVAPAPQLDRDAAEAAALAAMREVVGEPRPEIDE